MKVTHVTVIPKDKRITLEFEDGTFWTDVIASLELGDWWNEFEGVGDINLWRNEETDEEQVTIYPDTNFYNKWYQPTLTIKK